MNPIALPLLLFGLVALSACDRGGVPETSSPADAVPTAGSLEWAVNAPWRAEADKAIDRWREPVAVLEFMGVQPEDQVMEWWPTGGYWTIVIAPYLTRGGGSLTLVPEPALSGEGTATELRERFADPTLFRATRVLDNADTPINAGDDSHDHILTFNDISLMVGFDLADAYFREAYRILRPGGRLGIVQARGPSGEPQDLIATTGYVREDFLRTLAEAAGFELVRAGDMLANPRDTRDHALGVLSLPPYLQLAPGEGEDDQTRYLEIGAPDTMVLLFEKPRDTPGQPVDD